MRSLTSKLAAAAIGVASLFTAAHAEPLDPTQVPGDSKWVIHLDMDAVKKSATWKDVYDRMQKQPDFVPKVAELENIFNARFPDDLHGITLFGANFGDKTGVVLIHANVDRKQVESLLAQGPKNTSTPRGDFKLLSWDDNGVQKYGAFFSDSKFLVGEDKDSVTFALDTMAGKAEALKPDAALAAGAKADVKADNQPGIMIYLAGEGLAKLREAAARSPLLVQMKSAWITLAEDKTDIALKLNVTADNAEAAVKMQQAAEGLRAWLGLMATDKKADANLVKLNDLVQKAKLTTKGSEVSLEARLDQKQVPVLLDQVMKNQKK
jgi:hypothetical protein